MQVKKIFILVIILNIFTVFSAFAESKYEKVKEPLNTFELGRYNSCANDSDCVVANNGCCDCANGGEDVAINKDRLKAFQARFDCMKVMCTRKGAVPPCGSGLVSCVNQKCIYVQREDVADVVKGLK